MKIAKQHINLIKYLALSLVLLLMGIELNAQSIPLVNIQGGAKVYFGKNAPVIINGSINNETNSIVTLNGKMYISGSWNNEGFQAALEGSFVEFFGPDDAVIQGSGTTQFFRIIVNKETKEVRLTLAGLPANTPEEGFVELTKGLFRVACPVPHSNKFLVVGDNGYVNIPVNSQFWLDAPNVTVNPHKNDILLKGILKVLQGKFKAGKMLLYANDINPEAENTPAAVLEITEGTLNVARGIKSLDDANTHKLEYTQTGGKLDLHTGEAQYATTPITDDYAFLMNNPNSKFDVSGGEININTDFGYDYGFSTFKIEAKEPNVTGGKFKVFNANATAPENVGIHINSTAPIHEFEIDFTARNQSVVVERDLEVQTKIKVKGEDDNMLISKGVVSLYNDLELETPSLNPILCDNPNSAIQFKGAALQTIQTTANSLNLQYVRVGKTAEFVQYGDNLNKLYIGKELRLHGSVAILDIKDKYLEMPVTAKVTSGPEGTLTHPREFNLDKYIRTSGAEVDPLLGGKMARIFEEGATLNENMNLVYPIGDANAYAPAMLRINSGITYTTGKIEVKTVPMFHKGLIRTDNALSRYWNVNASEELTFTGKEEVGEVRFYYNQNETTTYESKYVVARYSPAWDDPSGSWAVNPGLKLNEVDYVDNSILSWGVTATGFSGDWTAGEETAFFSIFYSRADGNFSDKNTWSNITFGGPVAGTAPKSKSDVIYIQGNKVTLDKDAAVTLLQVKKESPEREAGQLVLNGEYAITGDEFILEDNTSLFINSEKGIMDIPEKEGHIRTERRTFSQEASYFYVGDKNQHTGTGLPAQVKNLTINKTPGTAKVALTRNTFITNHLHIEDGVFQVLNNVIDGATKDRILTMNGGELLLHNAFPLNYIPPVFTKGTVTFDIDKTFVVPSDGSTPAVAQYNNLKIISNKDNRPNAQVKFSPEGEIKIGRNFDIKNFYCKESNNVNNVFASKGSTVVFNGTEGEQEIPIYYNGISPDQNILVVTYNKVVLRGTGTKKLYNQPGIEGDLVSYGSLGFTVDTLVFEPGSKLRTAGNSIAIGKFWDDRGGTLITDNYQVFGPEVLGNQVKFFRPKTSAFDEARMSIANPENYVMHNVLFEKNTKILTNARFRNVKLIANVIAEGNQHLTVYGDWTQQFPELATLQPKFIAGNSTVEFARSEEGYIPNISTYDNNIELVCHVSDTTINNNLIPLLDGLEQFNNVIINNPDGTYVKAIFDPEANDDSEVSGGIYVKGTLTLKDGILGLRKSFVNLPPDAHIIDNPYQYVKVDNPVAREKGFVDGKILAKIPVGPTSYKYEVGIREIAADGSTVDKYMPIIFNTEGADTEGKEGYVEARIEKNVKFIKNNNFDPTNPGLKYDKLYKNTYYVEVPHRLSSFKLGKRTYNAELTINPLSLANESNANILTFASRERTPKKMQSQGVYENKWIKPFSYENQIEPYVGGRTATSLTISKLKHFGAFMLSHSAIARYYSRVDNGNWEDPNSWSLDYYNGAPATSYPGDPENRICEAYIGYQHLIKLNNSIVINKDVGEAENAGIYLDSTGGGGKLHIAGGNSTTINGEGRFRMLANSWLKIEHTDGIAPYAGCVRMINKDFNFENHNLSSFEYGKLGAGMNEPSSSGISIPAIVKSVKLIGPLKMDKAITVTDSLYIANNACMILSSNQLNPKRIDIAGNLRFGNHNSWISDGGLDEPIVAFSGNKLTQYVTLDNDALNSQFEFKVKNLHIDKPRDSSQIIFRLGEYNAEGSTGPIPVVAPDHKLQIEKELNFTSRNKASIRLENKYEEGESGKIIYGKGEWFAEVQQNAEVKRPGTNKGSFVDGELRMYVTRQDLQSEQGVVFHVGSKHGYRAFNLNMRNANSGIIGVHQISGLHPNISEIEPTGTQQGFPKAYMLKQYWRVFKDANSSFSYTQTNNNRYWIAANYLVPEDMPDLASEACMEFNMHRGIGDATPWVHVIPRSSQLNFGGTPGVNCKGRVNSNNGYNYQVNSYSTHTQANEINLRLGNYQLGNGRVLMGDFVLGERSVIPKIYYSKNNGNWNDPNTWVTDSYDSDVNNGTYPHGNTDMAYIGNGVTVNLNGNIGTGWIADASYRNLVFVQRLGGLVIEKHNDKPGRLNARAFRIRTSRFLLKDGGILETGYLGGIPTEGNRGNFINQGVHNGAIHRIEKEYNVGQHNNAQIIFKPYGKVPEDDRDNLYPNLLNRFERTGNGHPNIKSIKVKQNNFEVGQANGLIRLPYGYNGTTTTHNFDVKINLPNEASNAKTTFEVELDIEGLQTNRNYYVKIHADEDFNMSLDEVSSQQVVNISSGSVARVTVPVTLKNGFIHGTTTMRVYCMSRNIPLGIETTYPYYIQNTDQHVISYNDYVLSDIKDFLISIEKSPYDDSKLTLEAQPGIPEQIGSLTIDGYLNNQLDSAFVNPRAPIVKLPYKFLINDSLVVNQGYLRFKELDIAGKVVNRFHQNSLINYDEVITADRGTFNIVKPDSVRFIGDPLNLPNNTKRFTKYDVNSININSEGNDINIEKTPLRIVKELTFNKDRIVNIDNTTLILGNIANIKNNNVEFSNTRMIKTYHDTEDDRYGLLRKEVVQKTPAMPNAISQNIDKMLFPIGARGQYAPTEVGNLVIKTTDDIQYNDWAYIEFASIPKTPENWILTENTLDRMWKVGLKGNITEDQLFGRIIRMYYLPENVRGDVEKYIPGRYIGDNTNAAWDIDLGVTSTAKQSPIRIVLQAAEFTPEKINGYYTAGELSSMKERLVFYNRTNDPDYYNKTINWFRSSVWSTDENLKHAGSPSSYYPGQLTKKDIVNIDNGSIIFGLDGNNDEIEKYEVVIDSIHFGKTHLPLGSYKSELLFPKRKDTDTRARIIKLNKGLRAEKTQAQIIAGNRIDQILIADSLNNESEIPLFKRYANEGAYNSENMSIIFNGTGTSRICGEGKWDINETSIIVDKEGGLSDSLVIESVTYAKTSTDPTTLTYNGGNIPNGNDNNYQYPTSSMKIISGVLRNDTKNSMRVNSHLFIGEGGGLHLRDNTDFNVDLRLVIGPDPARRITDRKQTVLIEGNGKLYVGMADNNILLNKREIFIHENSELDLKYGMISAFSSIKLLSKGKFTIAEVEGGQNWVTVGYEPYTQLNDIISTKFLAVEDSEFSMFDGYFRVHKNNTRLNDQPIAIIESKIGEGFVKGNFELGSRGLRNNALEATPIKFIVKSSLPFANLIYFHPSSAGGEGPINQPYSRIIGEGYFLDDKVVIKGSLSIGKHMKLITGISDIQLGGSLSCEGHFDALSQIENNSTRVFEFNGSMQQTIFHSTEMEGIEFYNVKVNKSGGPIFLSKQDDRRTNMIIRNALEFAENNKGIINTQCDNENDYFKRAVYFKPLDGVQVAQYIVRNGEGHIYGTQCNYLRDETTNTRFDVGGSQLFEYYPMSIRIEADEVNTQGYLSGTFTDREHPQINNKSRIKYGSSPKKYWTLKPLTENQRFKLASTNSMEITLNYFAHDLPNGFNKEIGYQFMYSKSVHSALDPGEATPVPPGEWTKLDTDPMTDVMSTSLKVTKFGDIVLGELYGEKFYSIANGPWNVASTWSNSGYFGAPANRPPNEESDIVYISENKKVRINEEDNISVGEVNVVTKKSENSNIQVYGHLEIGGRYNRLITREFNLDDYSYLIMENAFGVCEQGVNKGAVFAKHRAKYGKSNYEYNSNEGPQSTGVGLPDIVLSIKQNNFTPEETSRLLTLYNEPGKPLQQVVGFLKIDQGKFYTNNRTMELNSGVRIGKKQYDGIFDGYNSDVVLKSLNLAGENYSQDGANADAIQLFINNESGLPFFNTKMLSNTVVKKTVVNNYDKQHFYIQNELVRLIPRGPFSLQTVPSDYIERATMPIMVMGDRVNIIIDNAEPNCVYNAKYDANGDLQPINDDDAERAIFYIQDRYVVGNLDYYTTTYQGNRGYVIRKVRPGETYDYYITASGNDEGDRKYNTYPTSLFSTAKIVTMPDVSEEGYIGMTTKLGEKNNDKFKHHFKLSKRDRAVLNRRYWAIDSVSYAGKVQLEFMNQMYDVADYTTSDAFDRLSRYTKPQEELGGKVIMNEITDPNMQYASYWKGTPINIGKIFDAKDIVGDWLLSNRYALRRIFFSRQNGNWNDPNSWTYDESHIGEYVGENTYPNDSGDSVVIANQNIITLNVDDPFDSKYDGTGVQVGYPNESLDDYTIDAIDNATEEDLKKTGSLLLESNYLLADFITVNSGSTIGSSHEKGIFFSNLKALKTGDTPNLSELTQFMYNGSGKQNLGSRVRNNVGKIIVNTTGDGYLQMDKNVQTSWGWSVLSGKMEMGKYKFNDNPSDYNMQVHTMSENTLITIGERGKDGPSYVDVFDAPKVTKKIDVNSTVEFIGKNHNLSTFVKGQTPESWVFDNNMLITGTGNTEAENTPSYFDNDITILGKLEIKPIDAVIDAIIPKVVVQDLIVVTVMKSVSNDGYLENNGVIEVGVCE